MKPKAPVLTYVLLSLCALTTIAPFLWMLLTSLKTLQDVSSPQVLPHEWHTDNYNRVFHEIPFARYYLNSFFVAAWVTFITILTSAMSAFAFSRMKWPGRDKVFLLYLATMMVPGVVTMIPNYTVIVKLQMLDSYAGLIIPASFSAFGTFMLRQFMLSVPAALDEAAYMDGATPWTVFWDVIMPIAKPGLAALTILTFLGNYGSFYWPLLLIKSDHLRTLPIGMMYFDGQYGAETNLIMAAGMMSMIPPLLLFVFGQKHLMKGIQLGAVKG
jgi:ABC-type glycerol-3-phosphate transport system permease component